MGAESDDRTAAGYTIRSVERVCNILDLLQSSSNGVSLDQVAEVAGLPRSSAFRYLTTLEARGYTSRAAEGGYTLGPVFRPLQESWINELGAVARPFMQQLSQRTGETINLGVLRGTRVSYVEIVESSRQVRLAAKVGQRDYLHCTALGKAIAAQLDTAEVQRILDIEGLPRQTKRTVTDGQRYLEALDEVRQQGYAVDLGENEMDGCCVAVALPDRGFSAAVSYSAPENRFPIHDVTTVARQLERLAEEIASALGELPSWR